MPLTPLAVQLSLSIAALLVGVVDKIALKGSGPYLPHRSCCMNLMLPTLISSLTHHLPRSCGSAAGLSQLLMF